MAPLRCEHPGLARVGGTANPPSLSHKSWERFRCWGGMLVAVRWHSQGNPGEMSEEKSSVTVALCSPKEALAGGGRLPGHLTPGLMSPRLRKRLSVSESSHTESDSSPPMTVRRRCSGLLDVPRFPEGHEEVSSTPRRQQQEGIWLLTPLSGEGTSGPVPERPVERRLKLDEEPLGQSGASSSGVAVCG